MGLEKINEMRKKRGLSIDELCLKSGVPKGTLSKITAGITKNPSVDTIKAIVYAMGYTLDDLDNDVNNEYNFVLNKTEQEHINKYRGLDEHGKDIVDTVLDKEYERTKSNYIELVARGGKYRVEKDKAIEFAKSAVAAPNDAHNKDMF